MKFALAMFTYLVMAAVLGYGILLTVQPGGKPWLLLVGLLAYVVLMARNGCSETH